MPGGVGKEIFRWASSRDVMESSSAMAVPFAKEINGAVCDETDEDVEVEVDVLLEGAPGLKIVSESSESRSG
jgi:hypothetical protein